jgi:CDP-paratose 2-epimerase
MFWHFYQNPRPAEVYNAGGSRFSNCSMIEAIDLCEKITGKKLNYSLSDKNRIGDHIWYISDVSRFKQHYPTWEYKYDLTSTLVEIHDSLIQRAAL